MTHDADVAVIGAGPAGLAAAVTVAAAGRDVVLVDAAPRPGGQYYRHRAAESGGAADLGGLRDRLGGVRYLSGHRVWHVEPGFVVHALAGDRDERAVEIRATTLVLATGAHDRALPFPGWDLPGVLTAGAAQALVKGNGVTAGTRTVVAGTGPFLLPVAVGLAAAGGAIAGVFEANRPYRPYRFGAALARHPARLAEGAGYAAALARARIPYRMGRAVVAAHGEDAVTAVTVARLDAGWRPIAGTERTVACDTVAVGYGFTPQLEIPLQLGCATRVATDGNLVVAVDAAQRTSVPGVYAAGEITGIGGAHLAVVEGELAGHAAGSIGSVAGSAGPLGGAGGGATGRIRRLLARRRRLRAFAAAMHAAYPIRPGWPAWLRDDTVVCRCEEVPYARLAAAVDLGATDPRAVKLLSRAGMGWCQGRVCGHAAAVLTARAMGRDLGAADLIGLARRPIAQPIRLGDLAGEAAATFEAHVTYEAYDALEAPEAPEAHEKENP